MLRKFELVLFYLGCKSYLSQKYSINDREMSALIITIFTFEFPHFEMMESGSDESTQKAHNSNLSYPIR